jgi:cyclopropane-fatty-acyl-phospholipid synthase
MSKTAVNNSNSGASLWTHFSSWMVAQIGVSLIGKPRYGSLTVVFPDGRSRTVGQGNPGGHATLRLNNFKVLREASQRGTVGFAVAYMNGDIEADDLTQVFRFFLQNRDMFDNANKGFFKKAASDLHYHLSRRNTLEGSKKISAMIFTVSG